MDFNLTPEQDELRTSVRRFARDRLLPHAAEWERQGLRLPDDLHAELARMGLCGMALPVEYGGAGAGLLDVAVVLEELASVSPACAAPVFETNVGPGRVLEQNAPDPLKREWLPRVAQGAMIAAAMTEPHAGSALTDLTTAARDAGGGRRVLVGQKAFTSGAAHSDAYLVYCRLSPRQGALGIGAVLIEHGREGLSFGPTEEYLGLRGLPGGAVYLDDVPFDESDVVVPAGGFARLMGAFNIERIGNASMSLGVARAALDDALAYVQERQAFGRPIIEFQALQLLIADMHLRVEATRLLVHRAAASAGTGAPTALDAATAKCFANQAVKEVADMAMQVFGGAGYTKAHNVERYLRDAYGWSVAGGTVQVQKTGIAAALTGRRFEQRVRTADASRLAVSERS